MGFATELKTIMKLDDSDWKKALESVKKVEKEYFKESKANTQRLMDLEDERTRQKYKNASQEKTIKDAIAKQDTRLQVALESGNKREAQLARDKIKVLKSIASLKNTANKSALKQINDEISATKRLSAVQTNYLKYVRLRKQNALDLQKQTQKSTAVINTNTKAKVLNAKSTENLANQTIRYLRWAGTIAGVIYAANRAWSATLGIGIQVNKMMEDNTAGIAALLSANTQMILSNGQTVNSYEKFQIGQQVAAKTMEDLRKASIKTYATFPQLTEIFQQAIGQTLSMGDAFGSSTDEIIDNTVQLSQSLSNIAGAIGMPMDRVREEIRSMLSGNASTDSLISTMLFGSPGEANKAIRDAKARGKDGLTDVLREMLVPFDALSDVDSYTRSLLQLEDAWSQAMAGMATPVFEDLKVTFKEIAITLNENREEIQDAFETFYEGAKQVVGILDNIAIPATAVAGVYALSTASTVLTTRVLALNAAMLANPVFLATTAAIATYTAIENWESLGDTLFDVAEAIAEASDREFGTELGKNVDNNREKFEDFKDSIWDADEALREFGGTVEGATYKAFSLGFDEELLNKALEETKSAMITLRKDIEVAAVDGNKEILKKLRIEYQAMAISLSTMTADAKDRGGLQTLISTDSKLLEKRTKENNKDLAETIQLKKEILINDNEIGQLGKKYVVDVKGRAQTLQDINVFLQNTKNIQKEIAEIELKALQDKMKAEFEALDLALEISNVKKEIAGVEVDTLDTLQLEIDRTQALLLLTDQAGFTAAQRQKADLDYHEAILNYIKEENKEQDKKEKEKIDTTYYDVMSESYLSILDSQIELTESTNEWGNSLDGTAGKIAELSKSFSKLRIDELKSTKEQAKLDKKFTKDWLKLSEEKLDTTELEAEHIEATKQNQEIQQKNEIEGYAQLAGAMSGFFEEGSKGAIAFGVAQQGLALINAITALTAAWSSAPFPANLPAVATTGAAVAALLAQIGQTMSSGGSSSSSGVTAAEVTGTRIESIEDQSEPILDRLDAQITLLESIDRTGTATQVSLEKALIDYTAESSINVQEALSDLSVEVFRDNLYMTGTAAIAQGDRFEALVNDLLGEIVVTSRDVYDSSYYTINTSLIDTLSDIVLFFQAVEDTNTGDWLELTDKEMESSLYDIQTTIVEFAVNIADTAGELEDASLVFQDIFDDLTSTTTYELERLAIAQAEVDALTGDVTLTDYLVDQIDKLNAASISEADLDLLLSMDPDDILAQAEVVDRLAEALDVVFEEGAKDALNYIESIELVAEAMASSADNISTWADSFKTEQELVQDTADSMSVTVATTLDELGVLFTLLSTDIEGLTDLELEFLEANKALIDQEFNDILDETADKINELESTLSSLNDVVDGLRSTTISSEDQLANFYSSMASTLALADTPFVESFQDSLSETIALSSILRDATAFEDERDQQFATAVAANQFESMADTLETELSVLQEMNDAIIAQNDLLTQILAQGADQLDETITTNTILDSEVA